MNGNSAPDEQARDLQILMTEHSNLQSARSAAVEEANGRVALYLGIVSSAIVAFAFVGQTSAFGLPFTLFVLVLLVPLLFVGYATYTRVLQTGIEDAVYGAGINRIRHFYIEVAPDIARYFVLSSHDDEAGVVHNMAIPSVRLQSLFTTSGMVSCLNSVLLGVFAAMLVRWIGPPSLTLQLGVGILTCVDAIAVSVRHQSQEWRSVGEFAPSQFPTEAR